MSKKEKLMVFKFNVSLTFRLSVNLFGKMTSINDLMK